MHFYSKKAWPHASYEVVSRNHRFGGVCKTRNTPNIPGTPPEQPGTVRNNPGTPLEHPIISRNTLETARNTPGTPKIVVSGQTAHELTKPKTSEDSQFFIRLADHPEISDHFKNAWNIFEAFKNSEKTFN